jgi:hypothetical protein
MKLRHALLFLPVLLILAPGRAEAGKLYLGGSVSQSSVDISLSDIDDGSITSGSADNTDKGWKGFVGFRLFKFVSIEVDKIDVGEVSISAVSDGSVLPIPPNFAAGDVAATIDLDGYRLSALASLPIGKRFSVFARFGYFEWDTVTSVANDGVTTTDVASDTDDFYGAGVAWKFKGGTSLRVEYETMTLDSTDVDIASVGLAFGF